MQNLSAAFAPAGAEVRPKCRTRSSCGRSVATSRIRDAGCFHNSTVAKADAPVSQRRKSGVMGHQHESEAELIDKIAQQLVTALEVSRVH